MKSRDIVLNQRPRPHGLTKPLWAILVMLLVVAVFDPADMVLHAKVPLFILSWLIVIADLVICTDKSWLIPYQLLFYVLFFAVILPFISLTSYFMLGGSLAEFDGFQYLKAYLFLSLAIVLAFKRIELIRPLSIILTIMSIATIVIYIITFDNEPLRVALWVIGDSRGVFTVGERSYGSLSYQLVYFHTSPLIVIALSYFAYRWVHAKARAKALNGFAILLNMIGMCLSGTRNNIFASILTPLCVMVWYSRRRLQIIAGMFVGLVVLFVYKSDVMLSMFSAQESDNALKLVHARDYMALFQQPSVLLLGQGLGARFHSTLYGYTSVTELTYFDLLRSYGVLGALVVLGLLLYPLATLRDKSRRDSHYLCIAYGLYLVLCISNPMLFSSDGMLLLALVIYVCWRTRGETTATNWTLKESGLNPTTGADVSLLQ